MAQKGVVQKRETQKGVGAKGVGVNVVAQKGWEGDAKGVGGWRKRGGSKCGGATGVGGWRNRGGSKCGGATGVGVNVLAQKGWEGDAKELTRR